MSLVVKPYVGDRDSFTVFLEQPKHAAHLTFMHTWEWGEIMQREGRKFERLGIYDGAVLVGVAQIARHGLKLGGDFMYCPRGIVLDYADGALVTAAYQALSDYCKGEGVQFLRVDPDLVSGDPAEAALDALQPGRAAIFTQAERVWCVDLQQDETALLAWMKEHGMRKNVAYYLRRAARDGVTVRASDSVEDLETFIRLLNELNERKGGIGKHRDDHYRVQFPIMAPRGYEKIFLAEKDGEILAAALISLYGREASYLHGASTDAHRELSAPHLLHFEIMKYCQTHRPEIKRYNFWGIVSDKNRVPSHPRHGYSEFKRSFGGYKETYIRARDFRYNWLIWKIDWCINKYRAWKHKND